MPDCRFYLGTHLPHWLRLTDVPLFLSARRLRRQKTVPAARGPWALDSGGFSELALYGRYATDVRTYAAEARRWSEQVGRPEFCAIQDWMCEPIMLKRTGMTVRQHQCNSVVSLMNLKALATDLPWIPVLQGWHPDDYLRHADLYEKVCLYPLERWPLVGVGSICRRQSTTEAGVILRALHKRGLRLHAFGLKLAGLRRYAHLLASADSMAWSFEARMSPPLAHCVGKHRACNNCLDYALAWRERVVQAVTT